MSTWLLFFKSISYWFLFLSYFYYVITFNDYVSVCNEFNKVEVKVLKLVIPVSCHITYVK